MPRRATDVFLPGLIGGLVAGAVAAAWFFVVDLAGHRAFETPAQLASIVLRKEFTGPWPRLVLAYSVLHLGVFATVGVAAAYALRALDVAPGLIVGAVFGVAVLNAVHYAGLLITGTNLLTVVPIVHVTVANVLGGMALMAYLHRAWRAETPLGWNMLKAYPVLYDGVLTGVVGATAVAFWIFLVDLLSARPFYTPAALGSAVLLGASSPAEVRIGIGILVAYSFLHFATFIAVGIGFAVLARGAARATRFWARAAAGLVALEALFLGTLVIVGGWIIQGVGWFAILIANALAIVSMALWTWRSQHRRNAPALGLTASQRA